MWRQVMRKVLKNKVVKYAVTAAMVMSVMMTTACNSKIKVDYGYNPTDYVELGDYKGIQAEVDVTAITNQVIDDKIAEQLESETTYTDVNREAQKGDKVKVSLRFRGREMAHIDSSKHILEDFAEKLSDIAVVDKAPKLEGRSMTMFLTEKR